MNRKGKPMGTSYQEIETPALRRIRTARARLVIDARFWGALALKLEPKEAPKNPKAHGCPPKGEPLATDGKHVFYVPELVQDMPMPELVGKLARMVAHCAAGHVFRRGARDEKQWDAACRKAIVPILNEAEFETGEPSETEYKTHSGKWMAAEEVYRRLPPPMPQDGDGEPDPNSEAGQGDSGESGQGGRGGTVVQGYPEGGEQPQEQGQQPGDGQGQGSGGESQPQESQSQGQSESKSDAEKDWRRAVAEASAVSQGAGVENIPGGIVEAALNTRVPWQTVLQQFVQQTNDDYSWLKAERRFMPRVYLPGIQSEGIKSLVLGLDTSGSIDLETVKEMLAELGSILDLYPMCKLTVIYHNSEAYKVEEYTASDPPHLTKINSGGTNFTPVFSRVDELGLNPECVIMLTDCDGPAPEQAPDYPVLWVSYGREQTPSGWGELVMV